MEERRKTQRHWLTLIFCLMLSLVCMALALFPAKRGSAASIPISLHSELSANYNADPPSIPFPEIQLDLIQDVMQSEAAADAPERLSNLANTLKTPVPTITSIPTPVSIATVVPQPQPSLIPTLPTLQVPTRRPTWQPTKKPKPTHHPPIITSTPKHKKKPTPTSAPLIITLPALPMSTPTHKVKP